MTCAVPASFAANPLPSLDKFPAGKRKDIFDRHSFEPRCRHFHRGYRKEELPFRSELLYSAKRHLETFISRILFRSTSLRMQISSERVWVSLFMASGRGELR
jgi:hypothetical protein